ncbi:Ku protein [Streptomyces sp. HNM0574]|uniref:non-homologous end joining protein Ku n=1 Tax=Streptomyces sp. HNM0574 TaxID=2714954 RepID=UPI00146E490B|nr:Ku protein [Streptomyces sp. HNM0574]NLU69231.1 Ku protein [Streptomyces sp. HNM0574]
MRSIWKGSISFGLVSIPIKVVSATESHSVSFHQVHTTDGGRIRYRKVCELEEKEVPKEEIGKGFQTGDGTTVQLTDDDLASLPLPTAKTVEILGFVPAGDIDPIQLDRSYFLEGDGQAADKPYALLRRALERSGKVAVAKLAMRGRESLGMLRVYGDVLALHTMLWPDEIRSAGGLAPAESVTVRDAELDLADTLMETLGELDWDELHDEYRAAVEQLVRAKAEGAELPEEPAAEAGRSGRVVDLMSVLENSVQAAKESRGEGGEATVHELSERRAAKRPASGGTAKKTAAKKSASGGKKGAAAKKSGAKAAETGGAKSGGAKAAKKAAKKAAAKSSGAAKKSTAKKSARPRRSA